MSYFRIIPAASKHHSIFDTVNEVARVTGMKYRDVLKTMGFESTSELISYFNQNPHPYFNKSVFISKKLNDVCIEMHAPIRVVRPYRERSNNEY